MRALPAIIAMAASLSSPVPGLGQAHTELWLKPHDQLLLQVKNEPDLSGRFVIGADGTLMLPVIGALDATARSFPSLESAIRSGFARELADPEMVITPLQRVSVIGEVRLPGFQWVDPTATATDLLVLAGGLMPTAKRGGATLVRGGQETRLPLNDGAIEPVPLRSGDQLIIARRSWLSENLPIFIGAAASVAAAAVTSIIVR